MPEEYGYQEAEQKKKQKKDEKKLAFEIGKVFSPSDIKEDEMIEMSLEASRFRAAKGEAGSRTSPVPPAAGGE